MKNILKIIFCFVALHNLPNILHAQRKVNISVLVLNIQGEPAPGVRVVLPNDSFRVEKNFFKITDSIGRTSFGVKQNDFKRLIGISALQGDSMQADRPFAYQPKKRIKEFKYNIVLQLRKIINSEYDFE